MSNYQVRWLDRLQEVPKSAWDALALPLATPFLEWEWLNNLETSGSVTAETGWLPKHLTLWQSGTLVAAAPLYLKGHSYGEFIFDQQWAEVSQQLGIRYYPKLVGMTPITPAEGYQFLIAPGLDRAAITSLMVREIDRFCESYQISSCHFLYVDPTWQPLIEEAGFRPWLHHSYIWQDANFGDFDGYLKSFNANQRRNIKRERKAVTDKGLILRPLTTDQLDVPTMSLVYDFYADTCDKFGWWGSKYLTREFFESLVPNYSDRLLVMAAFAADQSLPVGMSFCLYKGDQLYGRYWGSREEIDCLHFEACYYAPIEWSLQQGVKTFDPGAGGRHKKRRGFPATPNYSVHRFYHPRLRQLILPYLVEVNKAEQREIEAINADLPFPVQESLTVASQLL